MINGIQINSKDKELQMIEEYKQGVCVKVLQEKYGYKTKKSITDKIKKYYPDEYKNIIELGRENRKSYHYDLTKISSNFDAYFVGLMLTDGYVCQRKTGKICGIDLTDEDCIAFLSKVIGKEYQAYAPYKRKAINTDIIINSQKTRYRLLLNGEKLPEQLKRFGVVENKSLTLQPPILLPEEEKFIPYIIRGIIDGDGSVSPTNYGGSQFYICSMSFDFIKWCKETLENKLFMESLHLRQNDRGLWRLETANYWDIFKLIALVYDKPFGMNRKYTLLRKTFNDYNKTSLPI